MTNDDEWPTPKRQACQELSKGIESLILKADRHEVAPEMIAAVLRRHADAQQRRGEEKKMAHLRRAEAIEAAD